jgi:prophage regulatory protein
MSAKKLLARERERKNTKRRKRAERRALRVLRLPEVEKRTGLKHASIYAAIAAGEFPAPIPIGLRAVAWVESEIDDWLQACVAARDDRSVQRSLPLTGTNQRRKAEAQEARDRRGRVPGERETPRRIDPVEAREARGVRGRGERETSHAR